MEIDPDGDSVDDETSYDIHSYEKGTNGEGTNEQGTNEKDTALCASLPIPACLRAGGARTAGTPHRLA